MSTYDLYTTPVEAGTWDVPSTGAARFSWEYDEGRQRLLDLYQRGRKRTSSGTPPSGSTGLCPSDEARHVAFGRLALRDYYAQLTTAERADREEWSRAAT